MELHCIECEMMVEIIWGAEYHVGFMPRTIYKDETSGLVEFKVCSCYGPFAFSAPPEIEDGWYGTAWNDNLTEPDPEELEMMDRAAESLELEFANGI